MSLFRPKGAGAVGLKPGRASWLVVGFVAAWPGLAAAQETEARFEPPAPSIGQVQAGPMYFTPNVSLVDMGYITNVFQTKEDVKKDFTLTVRAEYDSLFLFRHLKMRLGVGTSYLYFKSYASQRAWNPMGRFDAEYRLSPRVSLFTSDNVQSRRTQPNDEITARVRHTVQSVGGGARVLFGRRTEVEIEARRETTRFESGVTFNEVNLAQALNRWVNVRSARVRYRLTSYTTLTSRVELNRIAFTEDDRRSARGKEVAAGLEFKPHAAISGHAEVGVQQVTGSVGTGPNYSGPTVDTALSTTLADLITLGAGYSRAQFFSYEPLFPYYIRDAVDASIIVNLRNKVAVGLRGENGRHTYQSFADAGPVAPREDGLRSLTGTLDYVASKRLSIGAYVTSFTRTSGFDSRYAYKDLRIGLRLTVWRVSVNERGIYVRGVGLH